MEYRNNELETIIEVDEDLAEGLTKQGRYRMKKGQVGFVIYIAIVLLIDLFFCLKWVTGYESTKEEIGRLTEAAEIAEHFMKPEYNGSWQGIGASGQETRDSAESYNIYEYRIFKSISENNYIYFEIWDESGSWEKQWEKYSDERRITCIHRMSDSGIEVKTDYVEQTDQIENISVYKNSMDSRYSGYFDEAPYYRILYKNGEYHIESYGDGESAEADREDFETEIGMKVEEIINVAEEDQELFAETMGKMKEYELQREKEVLRKRLLWANGISLTFVLLGVAPKIIDSRYEKQ